jgi:PTH1 family peptidyl-tRNA hydrolase
VALNGNSAALKTRIVAGLGNPGPEYEKTRHNVGFMVLDRVARELSLRFEPLGRLALVAEMRTDALRGCLLKPLTFMNRSGRAVGDLAVRTLCGKADILVVSDDFNLPLGKLRFRARGSAGGHKGLASIIRSLGTEEFPRLRCGIGARPEAGPRTEAALPLEGGLPAGDRNTHDFVLSSFLEAEREELERVVGRAAEAIRLWIETSDLEQCMNRYN